MVPKTQSTKWVKQKKTTRAMTSEIAFTTTPTIFFTSFGSDLHFLKLSYNLMQCVTNAYKGGILDVATVKDLPSDFHEKFGARHKRGYGLWHWKPLVILRALNKTRPGDVILYLDGRCSFPSTGQDRHGLSLLDVVLADPGVDMACWKMGHIEREWTRADLLHALGVHSLEDEIAISGQIAATLMAIRNTEASRALVREWAQFMASHEDLILSIPGSLPNHPTFRDNRHDQSVLSILVKTHKRDRGLCATYGTLGKLQVHKGRYEQRNVTIIQMQTFAEWVVDKGGKEGPGPSEHQVVVWLVSPVEMDRETATASAVEFMQPFADWSFFVSGAIDPVSAQLRLDKPVFVHENVANQLLTNGVDVTDHDQVRRALAACCNCIISWTQE
jgi:hypothetical protein